MTKRQSRATKQAHAQRAAERAAAIRAENERKERRRRTIVVTAVVIGVLTLVVAIATIVQSGRDTTGESATPPAGVVDTYGLPRGSDGAPVTVEIYEDFMCPFCGDLEAAATDMLVGYVDAGDVQVQYKMLSFLDRASDGSEYSTRAMNAVGVVLDTAGPEAAVRLHDLLYENQPAEGTPGLDDDQLVALAVEAGADEEQVRGPIEDRAFEGWVKNATDQANKDGATSTSYVEVNDEPLEQVPTEELVADLEAAIEAAKAE